MDQNFLHYLTRLFLVDQREHALTSGCEQVFCSYVQIPYPLLSPLGNGRPC